MRFTISLPAICHRSRCRHASQKASDQNRCLIAESPGSIRLGGCRRNATSLVTTPTTVTTMSRNLSPAARALAATPPGRCLWGIGDPPDETFRFCGAARRACRRSLLQEEIMAIKHKTTGAAGLNAAQTAFLKDEPLPA